MNLHDPTLDAMAVANGTLLAPYDLDERHLGAAISTIFEHRVDYADLYFQYTRHEGWSLDEGIVKSGSFAIEQGVGVRAVSGDKTAFAYSDAINGEALDSAARATRTIARAGGGGRVKVASAVPDGGRGRRAGKGAGKGAGGGSSAAGLQRLYTQADPIASLDAAAKVGLLQKVEVLARKRDPRVVQVMAGLAAEHDTVLVMRSDGVMAADVRPLVRISVQVIVEQDGRRELSEPGGQHWVHNGS